MRLHWLQLLAALVGVLILLWLFPLKHVHAADCPPGGPCKVLILTPQEEQALLQPGGVLDTAEKGAFVQLSGFISYLRNKIATAPAGIVPEPAKPKVPVEDPPK